MAKHADDKGDRFHDRERRKKEHAKQVPTEEEPPLPEPVKPVRSEQHPKRNDPCPCGSGRKYKQCCGKADR